MPCSPYGCMGGFCLPWVGFFAKNKNMKNLNELPDWEQNPRKITPSRERILAKTLHKFGDLSGIVFNTANQKLVGGHQRKKILQNAKIEIVKKLGKPNKEGTVAYGFAHYDGEAYAYREVFWDETTHKLAAIAANEAGGEWDFKPLKNLMVELDDGTNDMEESGWELTSLENLMNDGSDFEPGTEEDQGRLDEKQMTQCPNCGEVFDHAKNKFEG